MNTTALIFFVLSGICVSMGTVLSVLGIEDDSHFARYGVFLRPDVNHFKLASLSYFAFIVFFCIGLNQM